MIGLEYIRKISNRQVNEVANGIGVSRQAVSSWESKHRSIPDRRAEALLKFFNIPQLTLEDLRADVDTNKEIYLQGLYTNAQIDADVEQYIELSDLDYLEEEHNRQKFRLSLQALHNKIDTTINTITKQALAEAESASELFQKELEYISLLDQFINVLNKPNVPPSLLELMLKSIDFSDYGTANHDEGCDEFTAMLAHLINIWKQQIELKQMVNIFARENAERENLF